MSFKNASQTFQAACLPVCLSRAVTIMAVSPVGDSLAAVTALGLYSVDLLDEGSLAVTPITTKLPAPVTSLLWNSATGGLYAGSSSGSIRLYRQLPV